MKSEALHQLFLESSGICTDTRKITKNCLFFALRGDNFNGNTFTQEALDKGAYKVVIDDLGFHKNTGETILCRNVLEQLQKLATFHRNYLKVPIVALTGSNGKTTTKELINAVLATSFKTTATAGNLNNHIGVPLTLLSMSAETEIGIVEMGANHLKEIAQLCKIALPDYGYITNFGKAHLEGFGSLEGVIKGKTELYAHLQKNNKLIFVNANDPQQVEISKPLSKYTFGDSNQDCYVALKNATGNVIVQYKGADIKSNLVGLYNFHNIAAAIAIGDYFKVSAEKIKEAIEGYIPQNNRSQIIQQNGHTILLDAYNANPTSMMAALENFKQAEGHNKIMILGDMFELGVEAEAEHQAITDYLAEHKFGKAYLVGENFSKTETTATHITKHRDFETFKNALIAEKLDKNTILIKGSRGMALERSLALL
ncbi:UDP-N-acetylmuramoyl-tripeptide--D-alanyl-D-alanine ligase [Marinirhabdus gelatinilytica]|uniref:UDP-N-acetylmuramoyl-tripeptide--D-alanyl-D-alanine ligase n=1 Tax=Marinirhabdus gelatinilytica TaxID=1703343 RepID=A0A370Q7D6_9FLAO|nr:UDP-N-acetylmuramoyl-tripeptide--D-alanyl-D-alanine ligase [Marinirhabdus gelatinilytica]RDK84295.1 UDP-N-acetylmuramoyl-tripeptide--D-alanyl-D-alanine ligase [Marinirhabdus gelatinilytica]